MKLEGREVKKIIDFPVITNADYREAHEWTSDEKMVVVELERTENYRCFLTPTPKFNAPTTETVYELHNKMFDSFEDYKQNGHKMIYETKICLIDCISNSSCTCSDFINKFMCKHILGFILQLKL